MQAQPTERQRQYREEYLRSPHWRSTRLGALERAGHRCQVCNAAQRLDVHHRTYERLGRERPEDLTVLCRTCHETFHTAKRQQRAVAVKPGKPNKKAAKKRGGQTLKTLREVIEQLGIGQPFTPTDLASMSGLTKAQVGGSMAALVQDGTVVRTAKRRYERRVSGVLPGPARDALLIECPTCGAGRGVPCPMGGVHIRRYRSA